MVVYIVMRHFWEEDDLEKVFANRQDAITWIESTYPNAEPETKGIIENWNLPCGEWLNIEKRQVE